MAGMKTSVVIDCPVEEVFHFFLNPKESAPRMDPLGGGLVLMSPDGPPEPGTTFVFRQQVFGKTRETKRVRLFWRDVRQRPEGPRRRNGFRGLGVVLGRGGN